MQPRSLIPALLAILALSMPSALAKPPTPKNLALVAASGQVEGKHGVFLVREAGGGVDLNGDGDLWDSVLYVHNAVRGTTRSLALATGTYRFDGRTVAFVVVEGSQGATDLNGDGDARDAVLHVHDVMSGKTTNLGIASAYDFSLADGLVATRVNEFAQGGTDLNGDGDTWDNVVHVHDAVRGTTRNLQVAGYSPKASKGHVGFSIFELQQGGVDLNGDGDTFDSVMHVYTAATGRLHNTGIAGLRVDQIQGSRVLFLASESAQGKDYNGDGDKADSVPHVVDAASGRAVSFGMACFMPATMDGNLVAALVSEYGEGTDLNGDGDTLDNVAVVLDTAGGKRFNSGMASFGALHISNGRVAFRVFEIFDGARDHNGDGDAGDQVPYVYDAATGSLRALPAGIIAGFARGRLVLQVSESAQGATDLNGDGDAFDTVLQLHACASGSTTNLGLAVNDLALGDDRILLTVREASQGGVDLNGDGDTFDAVVHVLDVASATIRNLKLAGSTRFFTGPNLTLAAFAVTEFSEGKDLNGDGDMFDAVLHTIR